MKNNSTQKREKIVCDYCGKEVKDSSEYFEVAGIMCNSCYGFDSTPSETTKLEEEM